MGYIMWFPIWDNGTSTNLSACGWFYYELITHRVKHLVENSLLNQRVIIEKRFLKLNVIEF